MVSDCNCSLFCGNLGSCLNFFWMCNYYVGQSCDEQCGMEGAYSFHTGERLTPHVWISFEKKYIIVYDIFRHEKAWHFVLMLIWSGTATLTKIRIRIQNLEVLKHPPYSKEVQKRAVEFCEGRCPLWTAQEIETYTKDQALSSDWYGHYTSYHHLLTNPSDNWLMFYETHPVFRVLWCANISHCLNSGIHSLDTGHKFVILYYCGPEGLL